MATNLIKIVVLINIDQVIKVKENKTKLLKTFLLTPGAHTFPQVDAILFIILIRQRERHTQVIGSVLLRDTLTKKIMKLSGVAQIASHPLHSIWTFFSFFFYKTLFLCLYSPPFLAMPESCMIFIAGERPLAWLTVSLFCLFRQSSQTWRAQNCK